MVTDTDFMSSLRTMVRYWARLVTIYNSEKWARLYALCGSTPKDSFPRVAVSDWLPAPTAREIAELADLIAEERPGLMPAFAALTQRCSALDADVYMSLRELASCSQRPGWNLDYAMKVERDLDLLLTGRARLEELECCPEDLLATFSDRFFSQPLERPGITREMSVMRQLFQASLDDILKEESTSPENLLASLKRFLLPFADRLERWSGANVLTDSVSPVEDESTVNGPENSC